MTRRRPLAIPAIIAAGIRRAEKERRAAVIARPMRNLMDMLRQGEVYEIDGRAVMRMPEIDEQLAARAEWVEIAPAIEGWRDCWQRLAPDIDTTKMRYLADRLDADKPITLRLVEQARGEFEATISRIPDLPEGAIGDAIVRTKIAWEFERMRMEAA